nr:MAG TPA: hypothetical protein [Bacteriophage sp.]
MVSPSFNENKLESTSSCVLGLDETEFIDIPEILDRSVFS